MLRETKVSAFTSLLLRSVPPVDDIGAQQVPLCVDRYFRPFLISFSFVVFPGVQFSREKIKEESEWADSYTFAHV